MGNVKRRDMFLQVFLMMITFGLYGIYWFYQTALELKSVAKDNTASPVLWTVLLFVPFGAIYSHYKYSELFENISSEKISKWVLFILWLIFCPAVWFIVQRDLNLIADQHASGTIVLDSQIGT